MKQNTLFTCVAVRAALSLGLVLGLYANAGSASAQTRAPLAVEVAEEACAHLVASLSEAELADCGCPVKGCVRTQGYWGNKPGVAWPKGHERHAPFFNSGLSWQQVLDSPTRGDAYLILAHQYIAAVLNRAGGASAPTAVQGILTQATVWFGGPVALGDCRAGACPVQRAWSGVLDAYNNGSYPGAPRHCDES